MTGFAPKLQREQHNRNLAPPLQELHNKLDVQSKLEIGKPDDKQEKEADKMADKVMMKGSGKKKMIMMAGNPDNPTIRKTAYLPGHDPNPGNPIPAHKAMPKSKILMMAGNPTNPTIRKSTYLQKDQMAGYKGEEDKIQMQSENKEEKVQLMPNVTATSGPMIQRQAIDLFPNGTAHAEGEYDAQSSTLMTPVAYPITKQYYVDNPGKKQEKDDALAKAGKPPSDHLYNTYWSMARRFGTTTDAIAAINPYSAGSIGPSVSIKIPKGGTGVSVGTEYDVDTGINVTKSFPLAKINIEASSGEEIIFGVNATDNDRKRATGGTVVAPWVTEVGLGPYEIKFTVTGDAEFNSSGSGDLEVLGNSLNKRNVLLFIKSSWTGDTITVTAVIKDKAPAPTSPDIGSIQDADETITWTIVNRTNVCPTGLTVVAGPGVGWTSSPASYTYQAEPDLPPAGQPDYENQTVLESFGTITALGFTMEDLKTKWKNDNPTFITEDMVAEHLWGKHNTGTFVFNVDDRIADGHGGGFTTEPFKASALDDADGVGYELPQTYSCGGVDIGSYTIARRKTTANGIEVKKTVVP